MNSQLLSRAAMFGALSIALLGGQSALAGRTINYSVSNIKNNISVAPTPGGKETCGANGTPCTVDQPRVLQEVAPGTNSRAVASKGISGS